MSKIYRVQFKWHTGTITGVSSFHVHATTSAPLGSGAPSAHDVADKVDTQAGAKFAATIATVGALDTIAVTEETDPTDASAIPEAYEKVVARGATYGPSTREVASALCGMLKVRTNAAVRSGHGRLFLPPVFSSTPLGTGNSWAASSTWLTAVNALATELAGGFEGGAWWSAGWDARLVVYSRTRRARGLSTYWFGVTGVALDPQQRWLRSRLK